MCENGDNWRPPVVPKSVRSSFGRKKPRRLNNLDLSSDEQGDSDEDFKGSRLVIISLINYFENCGVLLLSIFL